MYRVKTVLKLYNNAHAQTKCAHALFISMKLHTALASDKDNNTVHTLRHGV